VTVWPPTDRSAVRAFAAMFAVAL
jgi:hypothetical protein